MRSVTGSVRSVTGSVRSVTDNKINRQNKWKAQEKQILGEE